jgi:hypothetical protein
MLKGKSGKPNEANLSTVRQIQDHARLSVHLIATCSNCGAPAVVRVAGCYLRCQPCANHLVNLWVEVRSNLDGNDS